MTARQVIAVCGKGGVGKTAYTAMLTRVLASRPNNRLLVVDADPALGLNYALGRESEKTIGSIRDEVIHTAEKGGRDDLKAMAVKSITWLPRQSRNVMTMRLWQWVAWTVLVVSVPLMNYSKRRLQRSPIVLTRS